MSGRYGGALDYCRNQSGGFLCRGRPVYSDVYWQAAAVSPFGVGGGETVKKTLSGTAGGGSKRLGDRCRNDSALLYTACRNGGLSGSHNAKAAGTPGVYFNIGIDADDLRYYFYGAL